MSLSIFVVVIFAIYLTGALLIAETKGDSADPASGRSAWAVAFYFKMQVI
jgi:preprotein translocase subunit SecG